MSRKILTFEEYVQETDRSEEIEKEITDLGKVEDLEDEVEDSEEEVEVDEADRAEEIEDTITDLGEPEDLEDEVIDNDGVPVAESDRAEEIEDEINDLGDVEDLEDEVEDSEEEVEVDEEVDEEEEDAAEVVEKMVSEMLSEIYGESCKNEAMSYDSDDYEDHTIESYMKENAALVAALSAESMREAYTESTEENMKLETFEAVCESMKESYCKKIDEMKESFNIGNVERKGLGGGGM